MESLIGIGRSESFADLNNPDFARNLLSSGNLLLTPFCPLNNKKANNSLIGNTRGRHSFSGKSSVEDPLGATTKPFGIGKRHAFQYHIKLFFNTRINTYGFPYIFDVTLRVFFDILTFLVFLNVLTATIVFW